MRDSTGYLIMYETSSPHLFCSAVAIKYAPFLPFQSVMMAKGKIMLSMGKSLICYLFDPILMEYPCPYQLL